MSSGKRYSTFLTIHIQHEYYDGIIPMDIALAPSNTLRKFQVQFKRVHNKWFIYGPEFEKEEFENTFKRVKFDFTLGLSHNKEKLTEEVVQDSETLTCIAQPTHTFFYYVTTIDANEFVIENSSVTFQIQSVHKFFEYVFFLRRIACSPDLALLDARNQIKFDPPQQISYENGQQGLSYQSTEKVKLRMNSGYHFKLIEKSNYGERILLDELKIPHPDNISIHHPLDSITAFYTI